MDENHLKVIFVCSTGYNSNVVIVVSNCALPQMVEPATWQTKEIPNDAKQKPMQQGKSNAQPATQKFTPREANSSSNLSVIEHKKF